MARVSEAEPSVIEGTLERIVFQNPESRWTVARLQPDSGGAPITVVGEMAEGVTGTPLRLSGSWVNDARYGRQFKFDSYLPKSPETLVGIERYLGSGLIPGIGPELAKRIVAKFGLSTLKVIDDDIERLAEVEGIGPTRVEKIAGAWKEQREVQDVMVFLRGIGISTGFAVRIYKRWGREAIATVRANPYRLVEIWGIGFKSADAIARNMGISAEAPARLETGLLHALFELVEDGHTHAPDAELQSRAAELLGVDAALIADALTALIEKERVVAEILGDRGRCLSLPLMHAAEVEAAEALAELAGTPARRLEIDAAGAIAELERDIAVELAEAQRRAIVAATTDKCVVITGGPGVGKTTIVRAVVAIFRAHRRHVSLAAPTGRAAKRLSESTGADAVTLHRLLEFQPQTGTFARGPDEPLDADVVIVDEASMIDIQLFQALVTALQPSAQLILVGDVDQLPSVGPGSVLDDVIASGAATVVRLTEIFRQAAESHIIVNAHRINHGQPPELDPPPGRDADRSDFYFVERDDPVAARETVVQLVAERIPQRFDLDPFADVQVLTPMHRGELGTIALNASLQERLNPARDGLVELTRGDRVFRAGDKVMQIRNDYEKDVFNGDIGTIIDIPRGDGVLTVELLDGRRADYERGELDQLMHAYAVSVHKSQGSEYPAIVLPLMTQHFMMLQRNLLYTAITRGRRLVVIVGQRRAINMAVRNQSTRQRWTWLAERVREATSLR